METPKVTRADRHNNPTACTVALCKQAGLVEGLDYSNGDFFNIGSQVYFTARFLGDPIKLSMRLIDNVGFYTKGGGQRWNYIALPDFIWRGLAVYDKIKVIEFMYKKEGGTALTEVFRRAYEGRK